MSSSEQRRASSARQRRRCSAGVRRIVAVDLLHHVEGRVVDGVVVAERERAAAPARRCRASAASTRVLAGHVVRGRQHVAERRPAQHPLVRVVADRRRSGSSGRPRSATRAAAPPVAPVDVRGEPRPQAIRDRPRAESPSCRAVTERLVSGLQARRRCDGYAMRAWRGCDGLAVAARVAGDAADGHVDAEAGGGALFFGLAAPEAVLAVLAGPVAALDAAPGTRGTRRGPAPRASTRASGRSPAGAKKSRDLAAAGGFVGPRERAGEDEVRDRSRLP